MDNWLMLVVGLAACVLIEVVAYRAYKRYRARKEALFTKESLGEVFQDMESTRAYLLRSKAFLKQCARRAGEEGDEAVACIVDGLLAGERAQLESLEALRQKLDVRSVDFQKKEDAFASLAEALESYASAKWRACMPTWRAAWRGGRWTASASFRCALRAGRSTSEEGRPSAAFATNPTSKWNG